MKKAYKWSIAMILLGFVLMGAFLTIAPDQIPVHYNIRGEVDRWGSKYEFLILPAINLVFGVIMACLARWEGRQGRQMNERIVAGMNVCVLVMFNAIWLVFMLRAVDQSDLAGNLGSLAIKGVFIALCASFIALGNVMPKAQRNSIFGLRTKWSMANDWCWQQSQRIGGYMMAGTGTLGVVLTAILPVAWAGYAFLTLILAVTVGVTYASYRIYQKSRKR